MTNRRPIRLEKTRICRFWLNGLCNVEKCTHAHGKDELRPLPNFIKTALCPHSMDCTQGESCPYAHCQSEILVNNSMPRSASSSALLPDPVLTPHTYSNYFSQSSVDFSTIPTIQLKEEYDLVHKFESPSITDEGESLDENISDCLIMKDILRYHDPQRSDFKLKDVPDIFKGLRHLFTAKWPAE